jgi:hypothetical protein
MTPLEHLGDWVADHEADSCALCDGAIATACS